MFSAVSSLGIGGVHEPFQPLLWLACKKQVYLTGVTTLNLDLDLDLPFLSWFLVYFFCARKFWVGSDLQESTLENEIALTVFQQRRLLRHSFT